MRNVSKFALGTTAVAATTLVLTACGGGGGSSGGDGTLRMALTDAPACGFEEVNVTVKAVKVHKSGSAAESAAGWETIELTPARRVNLLDLTNGVLEELGQTQLPAGKYTQLRLVLASNSEIAMANSVKPTGRSEIALDTPSGQQSGLKMNANIDVEPGKVADFVLDFDACKSVVSRGGSSQYNLKPVVSILPRLTDAGFAVQGRIAFNSLTSNMSVSLQKDGVVIRNTAPMSTDNPNTSIDERGMFVLSLVPAGTYDLVISGDSRATAVITGIPVIESARTTLAPVTLTGSTMQEASGSVSFRDSAAIPDATVRALQEIDAGKKLVEVISRRVDAQDGTYRLPLSISAPFIAPYSANANGYSFTPYTTAASKYTLEATVPNKPAQAKPIDLSSGDETESFTFEP